ncbi:MAG: hypothetical protein ACE5NP_12050 [Anaerolineae bacterium]
MNMGISILFPLVVLLSFVSIAVAAIVYFRSEREPEGLQRRFLPRFYVYALLFVSSLIFFVGSGLLLKAVFAYAAGMTFSYRGQPIYAEIEPEKMPVREPKLERIEYRQEERLRDLLTGAAFAAVGALSFALHRTLRNRVESGEEQRLSFLNKGYLTVSGVVYGGVALVLIPMSLYQLIDYALIAYPEPQSVWQRPVPGETLSFAIAALAIWLWILPHLFRTLGSQDEVDR